MIINNIDQSELIMKQYWLCDKTDYHFIKQYWLLNSQYWLIVEQQFYKGITYSLSNGQVNATPLTKCVTTCKTIQ